MLSQQDLPEVQQLESFRNVSEEKQGIGIMKKKKHFLRGKMIAVTTMSLLLFIFLSALAGYILCRYAFLQNATAEMKEDCIQFFTVYILMELIAAVIVECMIVNVFDYYFIRPLRKMREAVTLSAESDGEYASDMDDICKKLEHLGIHSEDEIGALYETMVHTQNEVNNYIHEIKDTSWEEEHDSMTMLANRNRFEKTKVREYIHRNSIFAARLDIVNLRKINESIGTEAGDSIVTKVARELRRLDGERADTYRLEEDHFLVVLCDYTEEEAGMVMEQWLQRVGRLNRGSDSFECCLAYGGAYGENNFDMDALLEAAEINMLANKAMIKNKAIGTTNER